jgi:hypothetical protein
MFTGAGEGGMKQIEIKPGIVVLSPWYNTVEAAAHCGMARSTFTEKATKGGLPCGGDVNNKRYQVEVLDQWISHGFLYPGTEEAVPGKSRRGRIRYTPPGDGAGLVDPFTKRVYGGSSAQA